MVNAATEHAAQNPARFSFDHGERSHGRTPWAQYLSNIAATQPPIAPAVLRNQADRFPTSTSAAHAAAHAASSSVRKGATPLRYSDMNA